MSQTHAMIYALAAFFGWVLMDTAIKLATDADLSPFAITGILGMAGAIGITLWAVYKHDLSSLRPTQPRAQAWLGLSLIAINYVNVIALKHLPLTIFYIVVFTAPLVIAGSVTFLKHEVLTRSKVICLSIGFLGVVITIAPRLDKGGEWIGYLAGMASVACFVYYTLIVRKMSQSVSHESMLFWNVMPVGIVGVLCSLDTITAMGLKNLLMLAAAGLINLLGNAFYNTALRYTTSTNVAQIHYTQIIFGAIFGFAIWHEIPTWNLAVGSMLIIISGIFVAAQVRKG